MPDIPQGRARRVVPLVTLTGRTAGDVIVTNLQHRIRGTKPDHAAHVRAAERYVALLGRSRGVLMKAGQILSFMSLADQTDSGSAAIYRTALARLQAQAPPMDADEAVEVMTAELGGPLERFFAEFDAVPFAAASIGQVHKARTHDGRNVAVKVQYPGVEDAIRADLANVSLLTTFIRLGGSVMPDVPRLDTRALADEIRARIGEEIDYRIEATNQREFAKNYRGHPFIRIPEVLDEFCTERVLTMEYVDGRPWHEAVQRPAVERDRWAEVIQRFNWGGFRRYGIIHSDPHPGNFLFHDDGAVTFLDYGSVKRFTAAQVNAIARMERAAVVGDRAGLIQSCVEAGFLSASNDVDPEAMADWISGIFVPMTGEQPFTYSPEFSAAASRSLMSPFGPHSAVIRQLELPPDFMFFLRMDAGLTAIMGGLRATGPWRAIAEEHDDVSAPATELGRLEADYFGDAPKLFQASA